MEVLKTRVRVSGKYKAEEGLVIFAGKRMWVVLREIKDKVSK